MTVELVADRLAQLAHGLDLEPGAGERRRRSLRREQLEAEARASVAAIGTAARFSAGRIERNTAPERGSVRPAARSAFASAVGRSAALAITSPVERISGPSTGSLPGKRANGSTAAFTLHCCGGRSGGKPRSAMRAPAARRHADGDERDARRLAHERHRARRARVRLEHVDLAVGRDRELHVEQPDDAERAAERCARSAGSPPVCDGREPRRRQHARGVAGVDAGLLDVLHDGGDVRVDPVAERVDVDLDRVLEEAVDEHAAEHRHLARPRRRCKQTRIARPPSTYDGRMSTG